MLTVEPATAPTNYIYQNLATGWLSRLMRRSFSNAVVALVLILSFALVVLLKSYQKDLVVRTPPHCTSCTNRLIACSFATITLPSAAADSALHREPHIHV